MQYHCRATSISLSESFTENGDRFAEIRSKDFSSLSKEASRRSLSIEESEGQIVKEGFDPPRSYVGILRLIQKRKESKNKMAAQAHCQEIHIISHVLAFTSYRNILKIRPEGRKKRSQQAGRVQQKIIMRVKYSQD